jgi:hypothetical protein
LEVRPRCGASTVALSQCGHSCASSRADHATISPAVFHQSVTEAGTEGGVEAATIGIRHGNTRNP